MREAREASDGLVKAANQLGEYYRLKGSSPDATQLLAAIDAYLAAMRTAVARAEAAGPETDTEAGRKMLTGCLSRARRGIEELETERRLISVRYL